MFKIEIADRLKALPPYLFREIDRQKAEALKKGADIINLGIGDPDMPTYPHIIETLNKESKRPENHQYPSYSGMENFKNEAILWLKKRFGIKIELPEIITLIGSKEGIAHTPLALINPGDTAIVTNPGYPTYNSAIVFAGGVVYPLTLKKENNFLPDLESVPEDIAKKAKLIFLNYPNNPTSAMADHAFFEKIISFAETYNIIVCHDAAYSEIYFDEQSPVSFLEAKGAKNVGIEFYSLSKTYNMTGWRIGFAAGNAEVINGLGQIKSNIDSGVFQPIQLAGIAALKGNESYIEKTNQIYAKRRDILVKGLKDAGIKVYNSKATFYLWFEVPEGYSSQEFVAKLLAKTHIVAIPGNGFGSGGEGFVRMALTVNEERMKEAVERIGNAKF